jgi:hypothetical protein
VNDLLDGFLCGAGECVSVEPPLSHLQIQDLCLVQAGNEDQQTRVREALEVSSGIFHFNRLEFHTDLVVGFMVQEGELGDLETREISHIPVASSFVYVHNVCF